jgi:lipopolysaccharide transport system permease protein
VLQQEALTPAPATDSDHELSDEIVIVAGQGNKGYLQDLWRYRELFLFLAWRDILVRYKQTVAGMAWAVVRPLLMLTILVFIFGKLGKLPSGGVPYALLVFCGLLPWQFFSSTVMSCGESLVSNVPLVSKVYFPRLLVPAGSIVVCLVDFLISAVLLGGLLIWYEWVPSARIFWLLALAPLMATVAFGVGIWIAALMVQFRDFRYIVPFIIQVGFFVSPVGFASGLVPEEFRLLYALNPMVGVIDGFRAAILGGEHTFHAYSIAIAAVEACVLLATGLAFFRRTERRFADLI